MIRKSGWLIFIVLVTVCSVSAYLFSGPLIRSAMIYTLEKAVRAEVNISRVSLALSPLTLEVNNLQVTDRKNPTHNAISFTKAKASLELWPALLGYYVIDDLTVDGFEYGAQRTSPGKVFHANSAEAGDSKSASDLAAVFNLQLPSAEDLLARANLQTGVQGKALMQLAGEQKQRVEEVMRSLPNKESLTKMEGDIKALQEGKIENPEDLANKTKQLQALQNTLKDEREKVRKAKQQLVESRDQLQKSAAQVREANAADWKRLQQLANLDGGGLAPLSQLLLGDVWGQRVTQIEEFYKLVKPYIPKSDAKTEQEKTPELPNRLLPLPRQPYPNFWVKKAGVNWLVAGGEATIKIHDITAQHAIINAATRFSLDVERLPKLASFKLNGDFKILQQMITNVTWELDAYKLDAFTLGSGDNAFTLNNGIIGSSGSLALLDDQITQKAKMILHDGKFASEGHKLVKQLADLLSKQAEIPLSLGATGLVGKPDVSIRSSLDKVLGEALLGEAKEKAAQLQAKLRSNLEEQLQKQFSGHEELLSLLDKQDGETSDLQSRIDEMLKAKLASVKDSAKDKVKDKLLKPLGDKKSSGN